MASNLIQELYKQKAEPTEQRPLLRGYVSGAVGPRFVKSFLATLKNGSKVLTVSLIDYAAGAELSGTGIPVGAKVVSVNPNAKTIEMSIAATGTHILETVEAIGPARELLTAPASYTKVGSEENYLWVICPGYSTVNPIGPCQWSAERGSTLPKKGNTCVVSIDNEEVPTVVSWEGEHVGGSEGPEGKEGKEGKEGPTGPEGKEGKEGPEGKTYATSVAMAYRKSAQSVETSEFVTVALDTTVKDPSSRFNLTEHCYVTPAEGYYHIDGQVCVELTIDALVIVAAYLGASERLRGGRVAAVETQDTSVTISGVLFAKANEKITLRVYQNTGTAKPLEVSEINNYLHVTRVGEGQTYHAKASGGLELGGTETNEFAIASEGVTAARIEKEAVTEAKIKSEAVTAGKIATGAVTAVKLGSESVETVKIKLLAVTAATLASEAVETGKIKSEAVTEAKIGSEAVTNAKVKKEGLEPNRLEKEKLTSEQVKEHGLTVNRLKETEITRVYLKIEGTGASGKVIGYTASGSGLEWTTGGGGSYTAGEGLELSGTEFKVKSEGIVNGLVKKETLEPNRLEKEKLTSEQIKAEGIKEASLEKEAVAEGKIKKEAVTNEKIVAAAGIPESKLSLPEMVKLTGEQTITGGKTFNTFSANVPALKLDVYESEVTSAATGNIIEVGGPGPLTLTGASPAFRVVNAIPTIKVEQEALYGFVTLFRNHAVVKNVGNLTMAPSITLLAQPEFKPTSGSKTTAWGSIAVEHRPTLVTVAASGTATAPEMTGLLHELTTAKGWSTEWNQAVYMKDVGGSTGTVTNSAGLRVAALTYATNNYSLISEGATVKLKHAGPVELAKGLGVWGHAVPASQHAALPAPKTLLEVEAWAVEVDAVFKEYGMTA